jgi:hypothetical protein
VRGAAVVVLLRRGRGVTALGHVRRDMVAVAQVCGTTTRWSTRHRGGVNICVSGNFFHSPQDSGEVVFIVVRQLL